MNRETMLNAAFDKVMGAPGMPNELDPDYERWLFDAFVAAIEAAGVRLVPVEATEEMAERGDDRIRAWIPMPTYKGDYKEPLEDVYRAMLAASPYAALKETGQ